MRGQAPWVLEHWGVGGSSLDGRTTYGYELRPQAWIRRWLVMYYPALITAHMMWSYTIDDDWCEASPTSVVCRCTCGHQEFPSTYHRALNVMNGRTHEWHVIRELARLIDLERKAEEMTLR